MGKHPFLAFDLETTGLDRTEDQILQIGAVAYGGDSGPAEFNMLVKHSRYTGHPFALQMNAGLLLRLAKGEGEPFVFAHNSLIAFVREHCIDRPFPVGFNVGSFDVPFFQHRSRRDVYSDTMTLEVSHRCVELGSLYANRDGTPGTSNYVVGEYLHKEVAHDALQDARDAMALHELWIKRQTR